MRTQIFLFILILTAGGCTSGPDASKTTGQPELRPLLLVSFDGFRHDYLDLADTPVFDSLSGESVRSRGLIPVFPTKTFPGHYSIATGLHPGHTGLIANTMYDPRREAWFRISDRSAVEDPFWYDGEPIWNTVEKQGGRAGTMFWVGSEAPVQEMRPTWWKRYDGSMPNEARIDTVVKWLSLPGEEAADLATLYFDLVDAAGHDYGVPSDSLRAAIREADRLMGYLMKRLGEEGLAGRVNLLVVSDHGMTAQSAERIIVLDEIVDLDHTERVMWDPVTWIEPKEGMEDSLYRQLSAAADGGPFRVYRKNELPERFRLYGHPRVTGLVLVADPGYTVLRSDWRRDFVASLPGATHGYDNALPSMRGYFLATGPAFRSDTTVEAFGAIHLYELMNLVMGTKPAPNDGSPDSVRVLLKDPR
ncbi:MAG: ectonucleotide pyrophosphatase/phosphodiesterase [Balneolaceae bacterium]|nr:ectonucleotide pyrophosphatase/phosphodiesterase [Balneolaceae bacterium]